MHSVEVSSREKVPQERKRWRFAVAYISAWTEHGRPCFSVGSAETPDLFSGLSVNCPAMCLEKIKQKSTNKVLLPLLRVWVPCAPAVMAKQREQGNRCRKLRIGLPMFAQGENIPVLYGGETIRKADISMNEHIMRLKQLPTFWAHSKIDPFVDYTGTKTVTDKLQLPKRCNSDRSV